VKKILDVKNLCKSFEDTQVLNNIYFKVDEGEFIVIMGRSGSGKSTLLYSISGMDRPTSGNVLYFGKDISKLDDKKMSEIRLKHMGFIFQHSYLLKNLSIRDNIVLPGFKAGTLSREQVNQNANALMIKTGILTISDKGSRNERVDGTGPAIQNVLDENIYAVEYYKIIPDEMDLICEELIHICDELKLDLILTNGGTGFSKKDVTPEATLKVVQRLTPGIPEAMRQMSLSITPKAMLSRAAAGIRDNTLIINLPGSPKGAVENLNFILPALPHGIEILNGTGGECAR
jgi:molybdenum cofactor synthesis domain-containing protein